MALAGETEEVGGHLLSKHHMKSTVQKKHEQFLALNLKRSRKFKTSKAEIPRPPTSANLNLTADDRGPQLKGLNWAKFGTEKFFSEGVDLQNSLKC